LDIPCRLDWIHSGWSLHGRNGLDGTHVRYAPFQRCYSPSTLTFSCLKLGGQYHWVSEFAPPRVQKLLSYFIGWCGILGYQVGTTIGAYVAGTMIQGLIILNNPDTYHPQRWHGTLLAMSFSICVALFNIFLAKHLPLVEGIILVLHLAGFVAIMVPLWVMAPRTPSSQVWTSFEDGGSWGSSKFLDLVSPGGSALTHYSWTCLSGRHDHQRGCFGGWRRCSAHGRRVEERF